MTTTTRPLENGHLDDTPVGDTLLRRFLHNQADHNALLARAAGGASVVLPGLALSRYDTPVAYLNQALLLRPVVADDPLLAQAESFLAGRSSTLVSAWPTPDLAKRGWELVGHPTFVVRGPQRVAPVVPARVVVEQAGTPEQLAVAERLAVEGYPMPEAEGRPAGALYPPGVLGSALAVMTASLDGEPVAMGASFPAHGILNLCLAATLPPARRKGVWEALAQARLATAPHLPAAAITSDYSRAGFEKLGFLPLTRMTLWARRG